MLIYQIIIVLARFLLYKFYIDKNFKVSLNMILHYLKVALRNLLKYRTHSLISVLCLAVGITFFTVMSMYVSRVGFYRDQPNYERRVHIKKKV